MIGIEHSPKCYHWDGSGGVFFKAGDEVPMDINYKKDEKTLPTTYMKSAHHTHRRTGQTMRGVTVEFKGMSPEEADELDDDIFGP